MCNNNCYGGNFCWIILMVLLLCSCGGYGGNMCGNYGGCNCGSSNNSCC